MVKHSVFIFLTLVVFVEVATAKTYYLSSLSGDDRYTSVEARNPNTPWKSLHKLNMVMKSLSPGDSVLFKRGEVFYGSIKLSSSGLTGKPIVFGAYGQGPKPVITSLVDVQHWREVKAGIYEADHSLLKQAPQVVIMNGTLQEIGRYPNSNAPNSGYLYFQETNGEDVITDKGLSANRDWTGAELVIRKSRWTIDRHRIKSHTGKDIVYSPVEATYKPTSNSGYFIQDHISTLDEKGEWYFDAARGKLLVYFGGDSIPPFMQVATLDYLISNAGPAQYLVFNGLHLKGANRNAVFLTNSSHISLENCDIEFSGVNGVEVGDTPYFQLLNSRVSYSLNNGIDLKQNTSHAEIYNNLIECTNLFAGMGQSGNGNGVGIQTSSGNNRIIQNKVINTGYSGIRFSGDSTLIKNNLVDNFCLIKDDGGGIYTWSGSSSESHKGREIVGNIVLNGKGNSDGTPAAKMSSIPAEGIYIDDYASGIEIKGNTVANVGGKGIFIHNARDLIIQNNTLYNNNYQISILQDASDLPTRNNLIRNNLLISHAHDQKNIAIRSNHADIELLSVFEKNHHINLARSPVISVHYLSKENLQVTEYLSLEGWKEAYANSDFIQANFNQAAEISQQGELSANLLNNSNFENNVEGYYCFSPSDSCLAEWDKNGLTDRGSLKVNTRGQSFLLKGFGAVEQRKTYLLRFAASADRDLGVKVFLRQAQAPYHPISKPQVVFLGKDKKNYEILFDKVASEEQSTLVIESGTEESSLYWLDNMSLQEAELFQGDKDEKVLFSYNHSSKQIRQNLNGTYVDVGRGQNITSFTLDPFSSAILWKGSSSSHVSNVPVE